MTGEHLQSSLKMGSVCAPAHVTAYVGWYLGKHDESTRVPACDQVAFDHINSCEEDSKP